MPIRTAEQASREIGHHFSPIAALARLVHERFRQDGRELAPFLNSSTRAAVYRQIFIRYLRDYCDATGGAHLFRKGQLYLVGLENKYAFRVKQLSAGFSVSVSPTHASEQYDANEMPEYATDLWPESSQATLLYLGWSIPENAPMEISVYLICNDEQRNVAWAIPLEGGDEGRGIQQPLPVDGDSPDGVRIRVKVKPGNKKANG